MTNFKIGDKVKAVNALMRDEEGKIGILVEISNDPDYPYCVYSHDLDCGVWCSALSSESDSNERLDVFAKGLSGTPCREAVFTINGKEADRHDFGGMVDIERNNADPYCCANMSFIPNRPTDKVLDKYGITVNQYNQVCDYLEKVFHVGRCGWCE